jgi:glycine betaine/proline transport system substrate-binding protein
MYPDATEGWYVPRYVVEGDAERGIEAIAPDLKSVADLVAHWELFIDPEEPDKGRFLNCPIGWGCEQRNNTKLEAYGLMDNFVNFHPGTGAALDAAYASANLRAKPIVGYYWEPTWLLGVHDMIKLEEPACTADNADACAFSETPASVTASAAFVEQADEIESFFANFKTSSAQVSALLAFMQENEGATRDDAAAHFMKNYADTWTTWVSAEAAQKIQDAM